MLSLSSLAGWEDAVLASVNGARGTLEERDRQIERSGLYGEYPAIVRAYEELFTDPPSAAEAVKRAVFLVWRGATELPVFTGIAPLPEGTMRAVTAALGEHVRHDSSDEELRWMVAAYHEKSPILFELFGATPALLQYVAAGDPGRWRQHSAAAAAMVQRGQMGRYWSARIGGEVA